MGGVEGDRARRDATGEQFEPRPGQTRRGVGEQPVLGLGGAAHLRPARRPDDASEDELARRLAAGEGLGEGDELLRRFSPV